MGDQPDSPLYLPPGTLLGDDYVIGKVRGHGGFGITYRGWSKSIKTRIAIKEFLPDRFAGRTQGPEVNVHTKQKENFNYGLRKFQEEAENLAKFQQSPVIVTVLKHLAANGTGYMIMDFVDGVTLEEYLEEHGNKISWERAWAILSPVMDALREVHSVGLLHRDIAPDNIYITQNKSVKLLDFGSARRDTDAKTRNVNSTLKPGYAPEEQYRKKGEQGPWTDVYGLCATFYRCITGQLPLESIERFRRDNLQSPSSLGIKLPKDHEAALMKGLTVYAEDRWQSIDELQQALRKPEGAFFSWGRQTGSV